MPHHTRYMQRCFELASIGAGRVSPNPLVGAVLVHNDRIIGEGWHELYGAAHAEVNCFNSVSPENQHLISESTLYCSLEPCAHLGKTPPCVDLVIAKKVPRVVLSNTDPNPLVAGKSIAKLRAAGIIVEEGLLEPEGAWINRVFFNWIQRNRPFVILKWAQSRDGFLGKTGETTAISGPLSKRLVHRWRAEVDAILVGASTAQIDNPKLNVRHYPGKNPLRILLDGNGRVAADRHLLSDSAPTMVFGAARAGMPANKTFLSSKAQVSLPEVLASLHKEKCASLLVEGGAQVLQQFIDQGLWDELRIIENMGRLGNGIKAPSFPVETSQVHETFKLGPDTVSIYSKV